MIIAIIYILAAIFMSVYVYISLKYRKEQKQWMEMQLRHQQQLDTFNKKVNHIIED